MLDLFLKMQSIALKDDEGLMLSRSELSEILQQLKDYKTLQEKYRLREAMK